MHTFTNKKERIPLIFKGCTILLFEGKYGQVRSSTVRYGKPSLTLQDSYTTAQDLSTTPEDPSTTSEDPSTTPEDPSTTIMISSPTISISSTNPQDGSATQRISATNPQESWGFVANRIAPRQPPKMKNEKKDTLSFAATTGQPKYCKLQLHLFAHTHSHHVRNSRRRNHNTLNDTP